jgi:hypothetical protein
MQLLFKLFCVIVFLFFSVNVYSKDSKLDDYWQKFSTTSDVNSKLILLENVINTNQNNNVIANDSNYRLALNIAEVNGMAEKQLFFLSMYFDSKTIKNNEEFINQYITVATKLKNNEHLCLANIEAYYYYSAKNYINPKKYLSNAMFYNDLHNNEKIKVKLSIANGTKYLNEYENIDAFRCFSSSLVKSKLLEDKILQTICREKIWECYFKIDNTQKAKEIALVELNEQLLSKPLDSVEYMNALSLLSRTKFSLNENSSALKLSYEIIDFEKRNQYKNLTKNLFQDIRNYCFTTNNFSELNKIYIDKYPEEYIKLQKEDLVSYNRVNACLSEFNNKLDSVIIYLNNAEKELVVNNKSTVYKANFYRRYAEFLQRTNEKQLAIGKYEIAFDFAKESNYFPWIVEIANQLDSLYIEKPNFEKSYFYKSIAKKYSDSINNMEDQNNQLKIEIENENHFQILAKEKEADLTNKKKNLQYMAVVILICMCFVILAILNSAQFSKLIIRGMAFISFIFLFEFIILLADEKIHHITHGEPLKIMGIKIVLISILLPLHHWVEHKVIHYLYEHRIIDVGKIRNSLKALWEQVKGSFKTEEQDKPTANH